MKKALCCIMIVFCAPAFAGSSLKHDEVIEFYPAAAVINADGTMTAEIHGRIIEKENTEMREKLRINICSALGLPPDYDKEELYKTRMKSIFAEGERGRIVSVNFMNNTFVMNASSLGGYFSGTLHGRVSAASMPSVKNKSVAYSSLPGKKNPRIFNGFIVAADVEGLSVISDIDDTVKISNVADKNELLKNTFFRPYKAVSGMAALYQDLNARGAVFHYVSGSPRQMYALLNGFFSEAGFPDGEFRLKKADLSDGSLVSFVRADQIGYKTGEIRAVMNKFPKRMFILIGDSGENDPEVYAAIAKEFPGRISAVCIRDVSAAGETAKRITALKNRNVRWILFNDGNDLKKTLGK